MKKLVLTIGFILSLSYGMDFVRYSEVKIVSSNVSYQLVLAPATGTANPHYMDKFKLQVEKSRWLVTDSGMDRLIEKSKDADKFEALLKKQNKIDTAWYQNPLIMYPLMFAFGYYLGDK